MVVVKVPRTLSAKLLRYNAYLIQVMMKVIRMWNQYMKMLVNPAQCIMNLFLSLYPVAAASSSR